MRGKGDDKSSTRGGERLKRAGNSAHSAEAGSQRGRGGGSNRGRGGNRGGRGRGRGRGGRRRSGSRDGRSNGAWDRDLGKQGRRESVRRDSNPNPSSAIFRQNAGNSSSKQHDAGRAPNRQVMVSSLGNPIRAPAQQSNAGPVRVSALGNVIPSTNSSEKRGAKSEGGSRRRTGSQQRQVPEDPPEELPPLDSLQGLGDGLGGWGDRMMDPSDKPEEDADAANPPADSAMVTALRTEISMLKNDMKKNRERVEEAEKEVKASNEAKEEAEKAVKKQEEEIKIMKNVNSSFGNIRSKLEAEREDLRRIANRNETRARELEQQLETLKNSGNLPGSAASNAQMQQLEQKAAEYSAQVDQLRRELSASQIKAQTLEIDLEFIQAKQNYDEIRVENLTADVADRQRTIDELKTENAKLKEQLLSTSKTPDSSPSTDAPPPTTTASQKSLESPAEDEHQDSDEPWLFYATDDDIEKMLNELDFTDQQRCTLDATKWTTFDTFLDDLETVFIMADLRGVSTEAKSMAPYSSEFWRYACEQLRQVCDNDLFLVVRGLDVITTLNPVASGEISLVFRSLVSCIAEAYEEASNPQRLIMVLPNYQQHTIGGEDPTGHSVSPSMHHVIPYLKWKASNTKVSGE